MAVETVVRIIVAAITAVIAVAIVDVILVVETVPNCAVRNVDPMTL